MVNSIEMGRIFKLSEAVSAKYDKYTATEIFGTLVKLSNFGSDNMWRIDKMYDDLVGSKDEDTAPKLCELYSTAMQVGTDHLYLIDGCVHANRGKNIMRYLAGNKGINEDVYDILPFVADEKWSDEWVDHICGCYENLVELKLCGCDLMSYLTPEHSIGVLRNACIHLPKDESTPMPNLDWIRDPHWRAPVVREILLLYKENPDIDWGGEVIKPWMCRFVVDEISQRRLTDKTEFEEVIQKWDNVSPKLEYQLLGLNAGLDFSNYWQLYNEYKKRNNLDGDELADYIGRVSYPDAVNQCSEYWHSCHVPVGAIEWLRKNGAPALRELPDDELWQLGKSAYYAQGGAV